MTAVYRLFPPTIHPMVIHFTIAIVYLAALTGLAGLIWRQNATFPRAFRLLLGLGMLTKIAAGVAGATPVKTG